MARWDGVPGQEAACAVLDGAIAHPVHAYLLIGPKGCGSERAARIFAAELISQAARGGVPGEADDRDRLLALSDKHPSVLVVRRAGAAISREQVREIVRQAEMAPPEGSLQVLLLTEFHLVSDAAPILLKTLEEPPPGTIFVVLAEEATPELVTIASRCVKVEFEPLSEQVVSAQLVEAGFAADISALAASASGGDLDWARELADSPDALARWTRWSELPFALDGSGHSASLAMASVLADLEAALGDLDERHAAERAAAQEQAEQMGTSSAATKALTERHARERRRARLDLLRSAVAAMLRGYRGAGVDPSTLAAAGEAAQQWADRQVRNPREELALLDLLWGLPAIDRGR